MISKNISQIQNDADKALTAPELQQENMVLRRNVLQAWQALPKPLTVPVIQQFHARQKFTLLAHNQPVYRRLGRELAQQHTITEHFAAEYITGLMAGLSVPASRKNHTNTLQHIQGFFKKKLTTDERQQLAAVILQYHRGELSLREPLLLINAYLEKHPDPYLQQQSYLSLYSDVPGQE